VELHFFIDTKVRMSPEAPIQIRTSPKNNGITTERLDLVLEDRRGEISSFSLFLQEISRLPLLSREEEVFLAERKDERLAAQALLLSGATLNGERERLEDLVQVGKAAEGKLWIHNMRWVVRLAKKNFKGGTMSDLVVAGSLGLHRAIEKFDHTRGCRLTTYATPRIVWEMSRYTNSLSPTGMEISYHVGDEVARVEHAQRKWVQDFGQEPTLEELAGELNLSPVRVRELLSLRQTPLFLDSEAGEGSLVSDVIEDHSQNVPEQVERAMLAEELDEIINSNLSPREAMILKKRYGLIDGVSRTLDEVGQIFGVTRERIRQIEVEAFRKLRNPVTDVRLREYLA
jgi:RNA polymerase primary sigma factor